MAGALITQPTDALPQEMADIVFTPTTNTGSTENVLFNYSCLSDGAVGPGNDPDWLVIANRDGEVIWYEDPELVTNYPVTVTGLSITRPDKHILANYDNSWLVEYTLAGDVIRVLCHDDGSGHCPDGVTVPDELFDGYISHDAMRAGGRIWTISSTNLDVDDTEDCEAGDIHAIVLDGLYGFDETTNDLDVTWDMRDAYPDFGEATCPGAPCANNDYWATYGLTGCDWSHLNSIWVDGVDNWLLSFKSRSTVVQVVGDDSDPDWGKLLWELNGQTGDDFALQGGETFIGQHHAWWTMDGTIRIFDNGLTTGHPSRGIEVDLDGAPRVDGTATFTESFENSEGAYCATGGSTYDFILSDDVLVTCPSITTPEVLFDEFDSTGTLIWSMSAACFDEDDRNMPSYRGIPNVLL